MEGFMKYNEALANNQKIVDFTFAIMKENGYPNGGGSYLFDGYDLICNQKTFEKQELLYNVVDSFEGIPKILEIGVYAGHSYLIMLMSNKLSEFHLIDPCMHGFEENCIQYIAKKFDSNFTLYKGRSDEFLQNINIAFDIIHIDGGHDIQDVLFDFEQAKRLSHNKSLIVVDDWDGIEPQIPVSVKNTFEVLEVAKCGNPNALIRFK
jgi:hypothetical protein